MSTAVFAQQVVSEEAELSPLERICLAKGNVTAFTYEHRDELSKEETFDILKREWKESWSDHVPYSSYVDMQRIINDAYRMNAQGKFRRPCCTEQEVTEQTKREIFACMGQKF